MSTDDSSAAASFDSAAASLDFDLSFLLFFSSVLGTITISNALVFGFHTFFSSISTSYFFSASAVSEDSFDSAAASLDFDLSFLLFFSSVLGTITMSNGFVLGFQLFF